MLLLPKAPFVTLLRCNSTSNTAITEAIKPAGSCRGVKNFISMRKGWGLRPSSPQPLSKFRTQRTSKWDAEEKKKKKKGKITKQWQGVEKIIHSFS